MHGIIVYSTAHFGTWSYAHFRPSGIRGVHCFLVWTSLVRPSRMYVSLSGVRIRQHGLECSIASLVVHGLGLWYTWWLVCTGLLSCRLAGPLCRGPGGVPFRTSQPGRRVSCLTRTGFWHQGWSTESHSQAVQLARLSARGPGGVILHQLPGRWGTVVCTL